MDNVGGVFVVLLAGMGLACAISVIEFVWRYKKLESKVNIKHTELVKRAITQTNTNVFNINRYGPHHNPTNGHYSQVAQRIVNVISECSFLSKVGCNILVPQC